MLGYSRIPRRVGRRAKPRRHCREQGDAASPLQVRVGRQWMAPPRRPWSAWWGSCPETLDRSPKTALSFVALGVARLQLAGIGVAAYRESEEVRHEAGVCCLVPVARNGGSPR